MRSSKKKCRRGMRNKPRQKSSALVWAWGVVSFAGLAYAVGQDIAHPAEGHGQRLVTAAEYREMHPGPRPVVLWKAKAREITLSQLTPRCEVHDWGCVLGAAN
jgi:hypothetical protein